MAKKDQGVLTGKPVTYQTPSPAGGVQMETFIPVSYTHLDVYKRQILAAAILRSQLTPSPGQREVVLGFLPEQRVHTTPYPQEKL